MARFKQQVKDGHQLAAELEETLDGVLADANDRHQDVWARLAELERESTVLERVRDKINATKGVGS